MDTPLSIISNVIDRLPTLRETVTNNDLTDYNCYSDTLTDLTENPFILTSPLIKKQDPLLAWVNDFKLGDSSSAFRGRNDFRLTAGDNTLFKIGSGRPYVLYSDGDGVITRNKKVYQFYLFQKSDMGETDPSLTGKMYLMVVSGEAIDRDDNVLYPFTNRDTVDIYELVGKPIVK
jgi:hypothetical protein